MDKEQARDKFRLADRLFNEQQFGPALKVLTELNAAFPNERHILYPMARCLTGLGRNGEALDLSDRIVRQFDYAPAMDLYKKLKAMKTGDGLAALESSSDPVLPGGISFDSDPVNLPPGVPKFDSGPIELPGGIPTFDSDPPPLPKELGALVSQPFGSKTAVPPPAPAAAGDQRNAYLLWGALIVGGFIAAVVACLTLGRPALDFYVDIFQNAETYQANPDAVPPFPTGSFVAVFVVWTAYGFVLGCITAYLTMRLLDALPFGSFGEDMKDMALYSLYCLLLSWTVIGIVAIPVILKRHYDLSIGKLFGAILIYNVLGSIFYTAVGFAALVIVLILA